MNIHLSDAPNYKNTFLHYHDLLFDLKREKEREVPESIGVVPTMTLYAQLRKDF